MNIRCHDGALFLVGDAATIRQFANMVAGLAMLIAAALLGVLL